RYSACPADNGRALPDRRRWASVAPRDRDSRDAVEVRVDANEPPLRAGADLAGDGLGLPVPDLEEEGSVGREQPRKVGQEMADRGQRVVPREEGPLGIVLADGLRQRRALAAREARR